jgi:hypothetical protein
LYFHEHSVSSCVIDAAQRQKKDLRLIRYACLTPEAVNHLFLALEGDVIPGDRPILGDMQFHQGAATLGKRPRHGTRGNNHGCKYGSHWSLNA